MGPIQWGTLGEWAAAVGTSSAVLVTATARRRDLKDRREQEALRVAVALGPSGGPPGPDGQPTTYMAVTLFNGSSRTVTNVRVELASGLGGVLEEWTYEEVSPGVTMTELRQPEEDDWAQRPSRRTFEGIVKATFEDADGKRWLRDSDGKIRFIRGRRKEPRMT
jgi:hypothetical protein